MTELKSFQFYILGNKMVKETENLQESGQSGEQKGVGQGRGQGATRQTSVYGNCQAGAWH